MSLLLTLDYKLFRTQSGKAWLSVKGMNAKVTNEFVSPAWTGSADTWGLLSISHQGSEPPSRLLSGGGSPGTHIHVYNRKE